MCDGSSVTWTELSGRGTVYARTIVRRGPGPWAAAAPYVVAYVELDEGPRVLANVEADDVEPIVVGTTVVARFVPVPDASDDAPVRAILRFAPAG
jgi:uncharacterized OB-fold protein